MRCFTFDENKNYVVYGAGGNCYHIIRLFQNTNYHIEAILDQRADTMSDVMGIPVYTLEEYRKGEHAKEKCVIIISIKNVFEHASIARNLIELGFENIIYKPFPILQGEKGEIWDSIDCVYEMLVEKKDLSAATQDNLVACSELSTLRVFKDELLISKSEQEVICWLPVELVCNYDREDAYGLIPISSYYPLVELYQYLLNCGTENKWEKIEDNFALYCSEWIEKEHQVFTDSLKQSMIDSRINVFYQMQRKSDLDREFFIRNAVLVKRIDSFRFCLLSSGRNRMSFLVAKGSRYIPVRMNKNDYKDWLNICEFERFRKTLEEIKNNKLFTTLQHPLMISYVSETTDYVSLFCMPVIMGIFKYLHWNSAQNKGNYYKIDLGTYHRNRSGLKVLSLMKDQGCMGRMLLMHGLNAQRIYADKEQEKISKAIDRLYGIKERTQEGTTDRLKLIEESHILVVDSRFQIESLASFHGEIIFMLCWGVAENMNLVEQGYYRENELFHTIWEQQQISGQVFLKRDK